MCASGWSLVQRSPTENGVSECDHEAFIICSLTRGCYYMYRKNTLEYSLSAGYIMLRHRRQVPVLHWPVQVNTQSFFRLFSNYQLNAHFLYSLTICMLYYNPQHVSSSTLLIFRRTNCIVLYRIVLQSPLNRHTVRPFTESDDTRACNNTICPPEDEQGTVRKMLRIIMQHIYCYRIKEVCIKLVTWKKSILWWTVRKKHQIPPFVLFKPLIIPMLQLWERTDSPLSTGILYGRLQRVTIPEAVIIQFVLLKMNKVLLETCSGL